MDEAGIGMVVGLSPCDSVLDGDPAPLPKGRRMPGAEPPNFRPMAIVAQRWMDQDGAWHGDRPWSSPHCARWGHSSPPQNRGQSPKFSAHLYCGQTVGCIKMPLGTEVVLGLRDIVFDVDPATHKKGTPTSPTFWPMSIVAKWLDG